MWHTSTPSSPKPAESEMEHVFVWRPEDVFGAFAVACIVIFAFIYIAVFFVTEAVDRVKRWLRRK